jgi:hypothetical protein
VHELHERPRLAGRDRGRGIIGNRMSARRGDTRLSPKPGAMPNVAVRPLHEGRAGEQREHRAVAFERVDERDHREQHGELLPRNRSGPGEQRLRRVAIEVGAGWSAELLADEADAGDRAP